MADLKRQLGLLDSTMINVGTIIASAIFIVPSAIAATLQATGPAILVWVVGGVVSLLGALSVAELGAAMPEAGGQYVYLTTAYGPVWGYLYGWTAGVVINPASIAAIAVGFATYLGFFVPLADPGIKGVAIVSIVALTLLNALGVKLGVLIQNVLTLVKIGLLAVLIAAGFVVPGGNLENFSPVWPDAPLGSLIAPFGVAMLAALWAYDGWIEITYVGGEVKDPERNVPRSIVLSTLIAMALYCLVTASFAYVLSPVRMAASSLVASDAAQVTLGRAGAALVAVAILTATLGSNNGQVLAGARIPYAMARDSLRRHRHRADMDLDRALVEGHVQPTLHLRRGVGVCVLRDVLRRRDPAAPHGEGPAPTLQDLGVPGHADLVHPVFALARDQYGSRAAA